jgi:hypothetical protein
MTIFVTLFELHPPRRYHFNTNLLLAPVTKALKWADGAAVRAELSGQVEALLGPKTEADLAPPEKKKKAKVGALGATATASCLFCKALCCD